MTRVRNCRICGKEFTVDFTHRWYCSPECVAAAADAHRASLRKPSGEKVCPTCGQAFMQHRAGQQYCSYRCRKRAANTVRIAKRRATYDWSGTRTCRLCGAAFEPKAYQQHFCSKACRKTYYHKISLAELEKIHATPVVCPYCGKSFVRRNVRQIYCSTNCGDSFARLKCTKAEHEAREAARKAELKRKVEERAAARAEVRRSRTLMKSSNGLTVEQMNEVIRAQNGDPSKLWEASKSWTPAQHKFAKRRYEVEHGLRYAYFE